MACVRVPKKNLLERHETISAIQPRFAIRNLEFESNDFTIQDRISLFVDPVRPPFLGLTPFSRRWTFQRSISAMADDILEASTSSTTSHKKHKDKSGESKKKDKRASTINALEAQTFSSELSSDIEDSTRELTVSDIVIKSDFAELSADEQAVTVLERFNRDVEKSAFTHNPALGRALERVDVSYFVLGHRNQNAELFDPRGQRYSTVFTADPKQEIKSLGPVLKTQPYIRAFGKHVLNVPAGHYARGFSKNRYAGKGLSFRFLRIVPSWSNPSERRFFNAPPRRVALVSYHFRRFDASPFFTKTLTFFSSKAQGPLWISPHPIFYYLTHIFLAMHFSPFILFKTPILTIPHHSHNPHLSIPHAILTILIDSMVENARQKLTALALKNTSILPPMTFFHYPGSNSPLA